jgi:hypothetical protein
MNVSGLLHVPAALPSELDRCADQSQFGHGGGEEVSRVSCQKLNPSEPALTQPLYLVTG